MNKPKKWSIDWGGRKLTIESGKLALLADASCTVQYGETTILATVVKSKEVRENIDYFPLSVDFEEKLYAAGKIKGSRFVKREGRPSDEAILAGRLVDRAIRPLFNDNIRNDVQVVLTALSVDGENNAAITSLIAASCVLAISNLDWAGPIAGCKIGLDQDNNFVLNITDSELEKNPRLDLVVAGTPDRLVMVESGSQEVDEKVVYQAMKWGCEQLQPVIDLIKEVQAEIGQPKEKVEFNNEQDELFNKTEEFINSLTEEYIFNSPKKGRGEREKMIKQIEELTINYLQNNNFSDDLIELVKPKIKKIVAKIVSNRILDKKQRLGGRSLTEIRELQAQVDLLPRVHGSGLFKRGDTQVLSIVTLGAPGDVQTLDSMEEEGTKRYMHHYNDAPYSYGEAGPMRGPSRRAIGHGALAERALLPVLPPEETFPYAIRVVSEVLGSNGSSSMASTCASSLALMSAGIPIKKAVAGIAMGLASRSDEKHNIIDWQVITDLRDIEDGPGGMDFKIAGTKDGITAIQMDTKTHGLNWEIVKQTLKQAKQARLEILDVMSKAIAQPKSDLSKYAPRIETIKINPEKIRDLIGPGGKNINKIIEETGVQIDIEQDGRVMITSNDAENMSKAIKLVKDITHEVSAGEIYEGTVTRLEDFGAFVQILPGQDGLVHTSEIAWRRINKPGEILNIGDKVKVKVKEIDNLGRINLSIKALKPKPDNYIDNHKHKNNNFHHRNFKKHK